MRARTLRIALAMTLLSLAGWGCASPKFVENKYLQCRLESSSHQTITFHLKNLSAKTLALDDRTIPSSSDEKHVFKVVQGATKAPFKRAIVNLSESPANALILEPHATYTAQIPIQRQYSLDRHEPTSIQYFTILPFSAIPSSTPGELPPKMTRCLYLESNILTLPPIKRSSASR